MVYVPAKKGDASVEKAAFHVYRHSGLFNALGAAALKARAGMLEPGDVIKSGRYEFVVDDDEMGEFVVVHIILPKRDIIALGYAAVADLEIEMKCLSDTKNSKWEDDFLDYLEELLEKWQGIKCINGPGDNLTIEKATYRKESRIGDSLSGAHRRI